MPRSTNFEELILSGISFKKNDSSNKVEVNSIVAADSDDIASIDARLGQQENTGSTGVESIDSRVSLEDSTETANVGSIDTRVETAETQRSNDVVSIDSRVSLEESTKTANVGSIDTRVETAETQRSDDVVSIDSRVSLEESKEAANVGSIDTGVTGLETQRSNDIVSIDRRILLTQKATQVSIDLPVSGNARHKTIDFSSLGYESTDEILVYGSLRDGEDSDSNPIIYPQVSGVSHESVTFIFSNKIPENVNSAQHAEKSDYFMDIIFQKKAD